MQNQPNREMKLPATKEGSGLRHAALIMWPAFLAACLLEALVFGLVDPGEIHWPGQLPQPSRQGVYTVAFFSFWIITMACNSLVLWLAQSERKVNAAVLNDKLAD